MPSTDPPPTKKAPAVGSDLLGSTGDQGVIGGAEITLGEADITLDDIEAAEAEISTGETDIELDDLELEDGEDSPPSPFERITLAPDVSEREYVARMMRQAPASDPVPPHARSAPSSRPHAGALAEAPRPESDPATKDDERISRTISRGQEPSEPPASDVTQSLDSSWPSPASVPPEPLTLDLGESMAPSGVEAIEASAALALEIPEREPMIAQEASRHETSNAESDLPIPVPNGGPLSFAPAAGDALELVRVRAQSVKPASALNITMRAVRDRFDVGDFSGALILSEGILEHDPESVDALLYAEHCRDVLKQMYISRLGGVKRVPQVAVSDEQLRWLSLDHRAGFLLSLVDGHSNFEEVLDISGMPAVEALRLLMDLLQQNVIKVG